MIVLSSSICPFVGWDQGRRGRESKERFHSRGQHLYQFIRTKESVYRRRGLSWFTNMTAVSLFLNTKMAAMTWCENVLYSSCLHFTFLMVKARNKLFYLLSKLINTSHPDTLTSSWTVQSKHPFNTWFAPKMSRGKTKFLQSNCNQLHEFTTQILNKSKNMWNKYINKYMTNCKYINTK